MKPGRLAISLAILLTATAPLFSCQSLRTSRAHDTPTIQSFEQTGEFSAAEVNVFLNDAGLPNPLQATSGITLFTVVYQTTNVDGALVPASGLLALPDEDAHSVITYLHGTTATRTHVPSQPGEEEGMLLAALAAGRGHILVAPDYIGLGESRAPHPYMHADTEASATIDLLKASRALVQQLGREWPEHLFLTGFSQGGHAVFAVQRELEQQSNPPFVVTAAAPVAGAFHLRDVSFPQAMTGTIPSHAYYLAYVSAAYARIYQQPLNSLLAEPYATQIPRVFDGDHESDDIAAVLPDHPRKLFTPEFLHAYESGSDHWFLDALDANDVDNWTPRAPVRLYYGDADLDVSPEDSRRAHAAMKARGADITAISVGLHDHEGSALRAIPAAILWFEEILENV